MKYVLLFIGGQFAEIDYEGSPEQVVQAHCDHHQMSATVVKVLKIQSHRFVQYDGYTVDVESNDV